MTSIGEAMEHFGLGNAGGPPAVQSKVYVIAEVRRLTIKTQLVVVLDPRFLDHTDEMEWFREQVDTQYFTDERALIGIPRVYVEQFGLEDFVLNDEQERHFRERVEDRAKGKTF